MRALLVTLLAGACLIAVGGRARAYPQFQLSKGQTCTACHYAPSGGGLLNDNGQEVAGDDLVSHDGDGRFLSGRWTPPDWLQLGGDFRLAGGALGRTAIGPSVSPTVIPMQGDLYARAGGKGVSVVLTGGLRGGMAPGQPLSLVQLREHYVMYMPDQKEGLYVRAGRFMAPYGLRFAEHSTFSRRDTSTYLFSETYGVSAGYIKPQYEVHATGFIHDFWRDPVELGNGAAIYAEGRVTQKIALGAQGRYAKSSDEARTQGGVSGKVWLEKQNTLIQAQLDTVHQTFTMGPARNQLVGYAMGSWFLKQGWLGELGVGYFNEDTSVKGLDRDALDLNLHWFRSAHWEFAANTRLQLIGFGSGGATSWFGLIQAHYRM